MVFFLFSLLYHIRGYLSTVDDVHHMWYFSYFLYYNISVVICQQLMTYTLPAPLFPITQEREYIKRLQFCNLCNLFATRLQPFKKHLNKPETLTPYGFTVCIFTFATFATYFRGSLYIEKTFFIFYFSTQPLKTGCKGCKYKYAP